MDLYQFKKKSYFAFGIPHNLKILEFFEPLQGLLKWRMLLGT